MELNLEGLKIENVDIVKEIKRSYIDYSMSVIVGRALPDVRDGMKPVHRRILYAMYEDNLTHDKPFRKSATTVGDVLGRYHPHGDSAVYEAMVRMAQPFAMRYPLIEGHGNFGNIDGDGAAAYRYTEARMERMADHMLRDIEKDVVDFVPNFDSSRKEPVVLPSRFPNLLCNGSVGIAVGMATNIPPHNLNEIIDAVIYLMDHKDADVRELMQFVKGPDFPTYGTIHGTNGITEAYLTGRGRILMRGKTHFETRGKKESIVITEIPYQVNKSNLVAGIADLVRTKRIDGITDLRDESCKGKIRIVIDLRHDANRDVILNQLYKFSQLQETFAANMLALVNGEPRTLTLKQMLSHYLRFQEEVTRRRITFDLNKALARLHILEGYKIAIDNIEEVIRIIRESKTIPEAKEALMIRFDLSDAQGQAIVEMPLGRLAGLEIDKILEEMAEKRALVEKYQDILAHEEKLLAVLKEDLEGVRARFGDERRTAIEEAADDIVLEDLIEKHKCVITITHAGYIKRQNVEEYALQNRGGQGKRALTTREEDSVRDLFVSHSHNFLFFFSNRGRVYVRKCFEIPEAGKNAKGTNVVNLEEGEKITSFLSIEREQMEDAKKLYAKLNAEDAEEAEGSAAELADVEAEGAEDTAKEVGDNLVFVTRNAVIKRVGLYQFANVVTNKGKCVEKGIRAMDLDEGDELLFAAHTDGTRDLFIAASNGLATRFAEKRVRRMGRTARGVRAMRLLPGESVCGALAIAPKDETRLLATMTENGVGKFSRFDEFTARENRGGKGMICQKLGGKAGKRLVGISAVAEGDEILIIASDGNLIRVAADASRITGRGAAGVKIMNTKDGSGEATREVIAFQRVAGGGDLDEKDLQPEEDEALPGNAPLEDFVPEDEKEPE